MAKEYRVGMICSAGKVYYGYVHKDKAYLNVGDEVIFESLNGELRGFIVMVDDYISMKDIQKWHTETMIPVVRIITRFCRIDIKWPEDIKEDEETEEEDYE